MFSRALAAKDRSLMASPYRALAGLAFRRPALIGHLVASAWAFRARGWWRRAPFLPLPPAEYLRWRMETAYGEPEAVPPDDETERFLRWARRMRRRMHRL